MCGIAGIYAADRLDDADRAALDRMSERIRHRGPDDHGLYVDRHIGLAHRRLSIIDLSDNGRQPLSNEDGSVWVAFNGEIYNFPDLRADLEGRGHVFKSETDTEVLVHLFEEFPDTYLDKLRGMFAFALWNRRANQLTLARDRLGKKPLYYYRNERTIVFASEIKALLEHPAIGVDVNDEALTEYLAFRFSIGRQTLFKNIYKVLPGETISVDRDGMARRKYWELPLQLHDDDRDWPAEFHSLFDDSVARRLMADVPLGAFLSGGLDSTSVVCAMAGHSRTPVKTFTMTFDSADGRIGEGDYARMVARRFETDHHVERQLPGSLDQLECIVYHLDEPIADPAVIPTFRLFEAAGRSLKVVLTGEGSDEVNAGYSRYQVSSLISTVSGRNRNALSAFARIASLVPACRGLSSTLGRQGNDAWLYQTLLFGRELDRFGLIRTIMPPDLRDCFDGSIERARQQLGVDQSVHPLQKAFAADIRGWLASDLLVKVDKMSMAHSVEARAPFLDHKLVEFSMGVPPWRKCTAFTTKRLLREAMRGRIPEAIRRRRQHGFIVPLEDWFRASGSGLLRSRMRGLVDRGVVDAAATGIGERYLAGDDALRSIVWRLVVLETWFGVFVDGKWKDC